MEPLEKVLEALQNVAEKSGKYEAFCPAHGDEKTRHLTVSLGDGGKVLITCHKGCATQAVLDAMNLDFRDLFPRPITKGDRTAYRIWDHKGKKIATHHRRDNSSEDKTVWWTDANGKPGLGDRKGESLPLYGASAISRLPHGTHVVLCEGEKATDALTQHNIPAAGTVTGAAGTPCDESLAVLRGHKVILWADADPQGIKHMQRIGKHLLGMGVEVVWFAWDEAPEKGDAADHPSTVDGKGIWDLRAKLYESPEFIPPRNREEDGATTFIHAVSAYAELRRMRRENGGISGIRTGLPRVIDPGIHGLNKGYSYIVAARPNHCKSLFVGQISLTAAMNGYRVLLQTPEMAEVQYLDRFSCHVANINYFDVQEGKISDWQEKVLEAAAQDVSNLPILVDDYGSQTTERVRQNIERHEPDLVVIDYLQFMAPEDTRANRNQQVGQISRELAELKTDYEIPVVIAAQLNRGTEHRGNSEPILSDLRDSGEIEQDADVVLMLHRPDINNPDKTPEEEDIRVLCRKNRMGTLWNTTLHFVPGQQWLTDQTGPVYYEDAGS